MTEPCGLRKAENLALDAAVNILGDAWDELRRSPFVQLQLGLTPARLPEVSLAEAQRRSKMGRAILDRLGSLDTSLLPHDLALTMRLVRFHADTWSREADWYWTICDPLGVGFFGTFLPTAYCGGSLLSVLHGLLSACTFSNAGDADRYLGLVSDYARLIHQFADRTIGQAERGMRMPRVQVRQARLLLAAQKVAAHQALGVVPERLTSADSRDFRSELERRVGTQVEPAFDRVLEVLSEDYFARAPESVGLGQYTGGPEIYAELVRLHTTLRLTPEQVHARGLERIGEIERSMLSIRDELGSNGDSAAFGVRLRDDARWRASTVEGVKSFFLRYMDRVAAAFTEHFAIAPKAPCDIAPLSAALEGSMTYGYYDPPRRDRAQGQYFFNARNLVKQPLHTLAALTYHELMPGHHLHFATQHENTALHPFRKHSFVTAFNEGWAEYAATLAGEIGLYEEPEERYGRLVMDAFLTCRLVVDTGMNALGWSLERAREYMREHSGMSEAEILTESVRYSADIPGQALAYKLGDTHILALRERVRRTLGSRFSLKDFHAQVLGAGAMPLEILDWHVEHEVKGLGLSSSPPDGR